MATINEKMTALADEIRELSGTTTTKSIDTMTTDVGAANTEITSQTELITQIKSVVDNLPEAGSSSTGESTGGLTVASVTISLSAADIPAVYTIYDSEKGICEVSWVISQARPLGNVTLYRITAESALSGSALVVFTGNAECMSGGEVVQTTDTYTVIKVTNSEY